MEVCRVFNLRRWLTLLRIVVSYLGAYRSLLDFGPPRWPLGDILAQSWTSPGTPTGGILFP